MTPLEVENEILKKEIQVLHGKLGAQGYKIALEDKYKRLQADLYNAYIEVERLENDKRSLRDDFAIAILQSILTNNNISENVVVIYFEINPLVTNLLL